MDGLESPWRVAACSVADPPPLHWREELAGLLRARPRRLGTWAELGLYGARTCLEAAGLAVLPPQAMVCVSSLSGSESATHATAAQCRDGLPLPFGFLQSQSSQLLAAPGWRATMSGANHSRRRRRWATWPIGRCSITV